MRIVENIYISNIEMIGVCAPFVVDLNRRFARGIPELPEEYEERHFPATNYFHFRMKTFE